MDANQEPQELATNESSVYDLKKHVKFVFRPGSVVKAKPTVEDKMGKVIDSCPQVRFDFVRARLDLPV